VSAIQRYGLSKVSRLGDLSNPPETVESQAMVEERLRSMVEEHTAFGIAEPPAAVELRSKEAGDEVDQFNEGDCPKALPCVGQDTAFKAGDRVYWTNCPICCENLSPFEIMWIEGEYAKLDLFSNLVPLSELLRPD
jgi:hypothetical protein